MAGGGGGMVRLSPVGDLPALPPLGPRSRERGPAAGAHLTLGFALAAMTRARALGAARLCREGQHQQVAQALRRCWCWPHVPAALAACREEFLVGPERPPPGQRRLGSAHDGPSLLCGPGPWGQGRPRDEPWSGDRHIVVARALPWEPLGTRVALPRLLSTVTAVTSQPHQAAPAPGTSTSNDGPAPG